MSRSIEGIVENHRVAALRRAKGQPVWDRTVTIKFIIAEDQENTSNEHSAQVANRIGAALRAGLPANWLKIDSPDADFEIIELCEGFEALRPDGYEDDASFTPLDDLNGMLSGLYDWADSKRVWLA